MEQKRRNRNGGTETDKTKEKAQIGISFPAHSHGDLRTDRATLWSTAGWLHLALNPLSWEGNIKEPTGLEWNIILQKAENREEWRKLVAELYRVALSVSQTTG